MPHEITRTPVTIGSEGSRLAAVVIRPAHSDGPRPAILFCHGWAGLKEHWERRAQRPFAQAGYVCLVFDYRGWGGSDGRMISTPDTPMLTQAGEQTARIRVIRDLVTRSLRSICVHVCRRRLHGHHRVAGRKARTACESLGYQELLKERLCAC